MKPLKKINKTFCFLIIFINIFFYFYTKTIKKNDKNFEKMNIKVKSTKTSIILLKYISLLVSFFILMNNIISINKIIIKIPLISSLYSLILIITLITQISGFYYSFIKIYNNNAIKYFSYLPFKYKISKLLIKYKYKISLAYIFLTYICIVYI